MTVGELLKRTVILAVLTFLVTALVMSMVTLVRASEHAVRCDHSTSLSTAGCAPAARHPRG